MKKFFGVLLLLASLLIATPSRAFTQVSTPARKDCTSGSTCLVASVVLSSNSLVIVVAGSAEITLTSCCGSGSCSVAWVSGAFLNQSGGNTAIQYCLSSNSGTFSIGPTWSSACSAGPSCFTTVYAFTSTGTIALDSGATPAATCTTFTWCGLTTSSNNKVVAAGINTSGNATGCSGGSSPVCSINSNGNGSGIEVNVVSYSAPSWTGTSGTQTVATVAFQETGTGGGSTPPHRKVMIL